MRFEVWNGESTALIDKRERERKREGEREPNHVGFQASKRRAKVSVGHPGEHLGIPLPQLKRSQALFEMQPYAINSIQLIRL